jgi:hypothetical protein
MESKDFAIGTIGSGTEKDCWSVRSRKSYPLEILISLFAWGGQMRVGKDLLTV